MTNLHPFSEPATWWGLHRTGRVSALSSELAAKFMIERGWVIFLGEPADAARAAGELARMPASAPSSRFPAGCGSGTGKSTTDTQKARKSRPIGKEQQLEMFAA